MCNNAPQTTVANCQSNLLEFTTLHCELVEIRFLLICYVIQSSNLQAAD